MATSSPSPGTTEGFQLAALSQRPSPPPLVQVNEVAAATVTVVLSVALVPPSPSLSVKSTVRAPRVGLTMSVFS